MAVELVLPDEILVPLSSGGLCFSGPKRIIEVVVVHTVLHDDWGGDVSRYLIVIRRLRIVPLTNITLNVPPYAIIVLKSKTQVDIVPHKWRDFVFCFVFFNSFNYHCRNIAPEVCGVTDQNTSGCRLSVQSTYLLVFRICL